MLCGNVMATSFMVRLPKIAHGNDTLNLNDLCSGPAPTKVNLKAPQLNSEEHTKLVSFSKPMAEDTGRAPADVINTGHFTELQSRGLTIDATFGYFIRNESIWMK